MISNKKGFGLAEVIIAFTLLVILISGFAYSIRFAQDLFYRAAETRTSIQKASIAFAINNGTLVTESPQTLTFTGPTVTGGTIQFDLPVFLQTRTIEISPTDVLRFVIFAPR